MSELLAAKFLMRCEDQKKDPVMALLGKCKINARDKMLILVLAMGFYALRREARYKELSSLKWQMTESQWRKKHPREAAERDRLAAEKEAKSTKDFHESQAKIMRKWQENLDQYTESIFAKWLVSGKTPLGNTTPKILISAAEHEEQSADGHAKNAEFYRKLARLIKPGKTLKECVSIADVDALRGRIWAPPPKRKLAA